MPTKKIEEPDSWVIKQCNDPDHRPPNMRVFKPGLYEHTCPKCGQKFTFRVPEGPRL